MDEIGDVISQGFLSFTLERSFLGEALEFLDLLLAAEGEDLQVLDDLRVLGVEEELMERVRAGELRIDPDGAALGLSELGAVGLRDERRRHCMDALAVTSSDQVDSGRQVPPLVGSTSLERHPMAAEEFTEVIGLQQDVAELREGDA